MFKSLYICNLVECTFDISILLFDLGEIIEISKVYNIGLQRFRD